MGIYAGYLRTLPPGERQANFHVNAVYNRCHSGFPIVAHDPKKFERATKYGLEEHALGERNDRDIFIRPLREALGCEIDYNLDECEF